MAKTRIGSNSGGGLRLVAGVSEKDARAILSELQEMPGKMSKASVSATRKTMRTAESHIAKKLSGGKGVTTLKSKTVKDRINVKRRPSPSRPSGTLTVNGERISLWDFGGSKSDLSGFQDQKGKRRGGKFGKKKEEAAVEAGGKPGRKPAKGASWRVYKSGKRERTKFAFAHINTHTGKPNIFFRPDKAKGGDRAVPKRDYFTAYGLSLVEILKRKNLTLPTLEEIKQTHIKNLKSQVDRFLKRSKDAR